LPYSAYNPDRGPRDFFLFGYIKGKLSDYNCESREDLLNVITEIFTGLHQEVQRSVFEPWVNRLKWATQNKGKKKETVL
jgi:hypothetical protein